ncbi:MAG: PHP domain-containing protein [Armatimonadota bacterium]
MVINEIEDRKSADLHVHTTASDGTESPEQVVEQAYNAGLAAIGIADHDTIEGVRSALETGERTGIIVVPGVEINTDCGANELHMLGYFIDINSNVLQEHLVYLRDQRMNRGQKIVDRLNQIGININMDRVRELAAGGAIGRPHIARAMVEAGYVSSVNSAFGKYLVRGTPAYVERYKLTPVEAIQIIRDSGGVAVMAHPGSSHNDDLIPDLVNAGMKGIEAYHTDHSSHQRKHYLKVAKKYNLVATGGSDYHGPNMMKMIPIGNVTCDISVVHRLKELADERKQELSE